MSESINVFEREIAQVQIPNNEADVENLLNEIKLYTMENFNRDLDVDDNILAEYKLTIET